jgi:hypothetical protein
MPIFNYNLGNFSLQNNPDITSWISQNFSSFYSFSSPLSILQNIEQNIGHNISLFFENQPIAFIHGRPYQFFIENSLWSIGFVDYLCILKSFRKQNIAPLMISMVLEKLDHDGSKGVIFKKDGDPMPFPFWYETNYFIKKLSSNPSSNLSCKTDYKLAIEIYNKSCQNKKLYPIIDEKYIEKHYQGAHKSLIMNDNVLILGREGNVEGMGRILDIDGIFLKPITKINWNEIETFLGNLGYEYVSVVKMGDIVNLIKDVEFEKGNVVRFYLYNMVIKRYEMDEIWINFT